MTSVRDRTRPGAAVAPKPAERPPSKNEGLKAASEGLAGTLAVEVADQSTPRISEGSSQLL
jgi:hypothetical protein